MAIGGLVLLGIIGVFAYFLFPHFITGILRGPSYTDIIRAQESEIAAFQSRNRSCVLLFDGIMDDENLPQNRVEWSAGAPMKTGFNR